MKNRFVLWLWLGLLPGLSACNHLFYYPSSQEFRKPDQFPFKVQVLSIPREGDQPLNAWLMNDAPDSKGLILHFHGNAQNLTAHAGFSAWLAAAGYTVLIFDYSGYGATPGKPSQPQLITDSQAVMRWITANDRWKKRGKPYIVLGQSLGGAVANTTLAETPEFADQVDLLIIESSFDSYQDLALAKLKSNAVTWLFTPSAYLLVSDYRRPIDAVRKLKMKKLFIHGNADRVVPFANGKKLYEAALPPKEFWEIPYGDHIEAFIDGSPYRAQLLEALSKIH